MPFDHSRHETNYESLRHVHQIIEIRSSLARHLQAPGGPRSGGTDFSFGIRQDYVEQHGRSTDPSRHPVDVRNYLQYGGARPRLRVNGNTRPNFWTFYQYG